MRAEDVLLAFPALLLAFLFVASFGKGIANAIIALGIVYVPMLSRLTRSLTLMEKNKTYVESARSIGFSDTRIIFRHILPNCIPTIIAQLTLDIRILLYFQYICSREVSSYIRRTERI